MNLAPNGKPSNLTPEQYRLVRTPAFISWFGDWINSPETASKVVDENGEPLVVYHSTNKKFNTFDKSKIGTQNDFGTLGSGFYFDSLLEKKIEGEDRNPITLWADKIILSCFLNIKNPKINDRVWFFEKKESVAYTNKLIKESYDGILSESYYDGTYYPHWIVAFKPEQIKLADGSNTVFDGSNPDIRFGDGGGVGEVISKELSYPSGSSLDYYNGKIYLTGDDARYISIMDTDFNEIDGIPLFDHNQARIPKKEKRDIETSCLVNINGQDTLLLFGSGSRTKRKKLFLIPLDTEEVLEAEDSMEPKDSVFIGKFIGKLYENGIDDVNIEGSTTTKTHLILSNRGNKTNPDNFIIAAEKDFWTNRHPKITITKLDLPKGLGMSEMTYDPEKDILFFTASVENTSNSFDDGDVGDSFIGYVLSITSKLSSGDSVNTIAPDRLINLPEYDKAFEGHKIEGICLEDYENGYIIDLVSDNDDGKSTMFKMRLEDIYHEAEWDNAGWGFDKAADGKYINPQDVKMFPARDIEGMEDIDDLERLLNSRLVGLDNGKFTEEAARNKIKWAESVDILNPVDLTIGNDGTPMISDGHHRALAARILGKDLAVNIKTGLKPDIFSKYIDRVRRGFSLREINPDNKSNLNNTQYYEIPDLSVMNNIKGKDLARGRIFEYYLAKTGNPEDANPVLVKSIEEDFDNFRRSEIERVRKKFNRIDKAANGAEINEEAQQYIDIISMNPKLEKYQKYKDVLRDKHGIDFDAIYKDQQYIDGADLKDIKNQEDFFDFGNWLKYAKKISYLRGFVPMDYYDTPSTIKSVTDDVWRNLSNKLGFEAQKVEYIERGGEGGDIARALGNTIQYTEMADLYYLLHEIGHIYDFQNQLTGIVKNPAYSPTRYGTINGGETFAENFAIYFINPSALKNWNKQVYEAVDLAISNEYKTELKKLFHPVILNNGGLIAPNGKPSNLTPKQYQIVRTPEFKAWFGDWENDPNNASKIIDENGEPLVARHFSQSSKMHTIFKEKAKKNDWSVSQKGIYFTSLSAKELNDAYNRTGRGILYEVFLNVRNLLDLGIYDTYDFVSGKPVYWKEHHFAMLEKYVNKGRVGDFDDYTEFDKNVDYTSIQDVSEKSKDKILKLGYDGIWGNRPNNIYDTIDEIVVFDSKQIKLADGSNTKFDSKKPDIRFDDGGDVGESSKKIAIGLYLYKGFYISAYRGSLQTIWNIYKDKDCTQEYAIGFLTKKDAIEYIILNPDIRFDDGGRTGVIYTPEFKNWFGDWENDPENSSKAVSQQPLAKFNTFGNKPQIYYHGSTEKGITIFDRAKSKSNENTIGQFIYFSKEKKYSSQERFIGKEGVVYEVYLNIRNPLNLFDEVGATDVSRFFRFTGAKNKPDSFSKEWRGDWSSVFEEILSQNENPDLATAVMKFGYDAVYYHNSAGEEMFAVINSNQVKSAVGNTTFDSKNDNIYAQDGTEIPVIDEESYLATHGASRQSFGDSALHKNRGGASDKAWTKIVDAQAKRDRELMDLREKLRAEYNEKVAKGEIRPPSHMEKLISTAQGNPDREDVQAARRLLTKRGISWDK